MTTMTGRFTVTGGSEDAYDEEGGMRLTHAEGHQTFSGDIEGAGSVHWLMAFRPDKTARFVGLQRISGTIGGRRGSVVLTADGDHEAGAARIRMRVVDGSGADDLTGIGGEGTLEAPGGADGTYRFDFTFDG